MDITPEETRIRSDKSTQTNIDGTTIQLASQIVKDYESIDNSTKKLKKQNKNLWRLCKCLSAITLVAIVWKYGSNVRP